MTETGVPHYHFSTTLHRSEPVQATIPGGMGLDQCNLWKSQAKDGFGGIDS